MKQVTLNDLNVSLAFNDMAYMDHEDRVKYTEEGKRTDEVIGSSVDVFGINADGEKKVFAVKTDEILKPGAFRLGQKLEIVDPKVSAWFDRGTNALRVSVKAKTVKGL